MRKASSFLSLLCQWSQKTLMFSHYHMLRLHRSAYRRPYFWSGLAVICVLITAFNISKLKVQLSSDDMDGGHLESAQNYLDLKQNFKEKTSVLIFAKSRSGQWTEKLLCDLRTYLMYDISNSEGLLEVSSSFHIHRADFQSRHLFFPRRISLNCSAASEKIISLENLKQSEWGKIFVGDSNDIVITISFEDVPDFKFGSFDPAVLDKIKNSLQEKFSSQIDFKYLGSAEYMSEVLYGINHTQWINLAFCLILIFALWFAFGTWTIGLLYVSILIFSFSLLMSLKALFHSPSDALSDTLFIMLGVASLEDFVFISTMMLKNSFRRAHRKMILPAL